MHLDDYLNDRGEQLADAVVRECVWESLPKYAFTQTSTLTEDGRPMADYLDEEPFATLVQGRQMARDWCAGGAQVRFDTVLTPAHIAAMPEFGTRAVPWLAKVLSGTPGGSTCGLF